MKYIVTVHDNFHQMEPDGNPGHRDGEFDTLEAAIAHAKELIDKCVADLYSQLSKQPNQPEITAEYLSRQYNAFGDTTYVVADDNVVHFSGWKYAEQRCTEIVT